MKLRNQILLFSSIFALAPLLLAVVINLPLVLERMELFYQKAHLQNLRADFRDLDQHLASRNEMVRLLAKLPEPGLVLGTRKEADKRSIDQGRARYVEWINQILRDQLDIVQITFFDQQGKEQFWLERNPSNTAWHPTTEQPSRPPEELLSTTMSIDAGAVMVSAINIDEKRGSNDIRRLMNLHLLSPIVPPEKQDPIGAIALSIDVGGMARAYHNTLWVHADGKFLKNPNPEAPSGNAFALFPGLQTLFSENKATLWKGNGKQIMWVPMFRTERAGALWVGRPVDSSPIAQFRQTLTLRVLTIVFLIMLATWLVARWIAKKIDNASHQLTDGIQHILENDDSVAFHWKGPKELEQLGEHLSKLAREHAQASKELQRHAKELEQTNRYKSQFLANISHELKTPLNSILLLSKLLQDTDSLNAEDRKKLQVIHHAAADLEGLIDNVLDLSRIEAGKTPLHLQPSNLRTLLSDITEILRPQFEQKGLSLALKIDPETPDTWHTDADRLGQIIKNFLSNSVKFTEQGGATVELSPMHPSQHTESGVMISVTDSGIGIPIAQQKQIFEAFKQADGATNRKYGGTGLGLAISQQLANLLDGYIELESEPGNGSRFTLYLPTGTEQTASKQQNESNTTTSSEQDNEAEEPASIDFNRSHLLLIDGDVQSLLQLTQTLEQWNLQLTAAGDLEEAEEALSDEPSLILFDVSNVTEQPEQILSTLANASEAQIITIGPTCSKAEQRRLQSTGASCYLEKPYQKQELLALLSKFLQPKEESRPDESL